MCRDRAAWWAALSPASSVFSSSSLVRFLRHWTCPFWAATTASGHRCSSPLKRSLFEERDIFWRRRRGMGRNSLTHLSGGDGMAEVRSGTPRSNIGANNRLRRGLGGVRCVQIYSDTKQTLRNGMIYSRRGLRRESARGPASGSCRPSPCASSGARGQRWRASWRRTQKGKYRTDSRGENQRDPREPREFWGRWPWWARTCRGSRTTGSAGLEGAYLGGRGSRAPGQSSQRGLGKQVIAAMARDSEDECSRVHANLM